jgi:hypothetical protein
LIRIAGRIFKEPVLDLNSFGMAAGDALLIGLIKTAAVGDDEVPAS